MTLHEKQALFAQLAAKLIIYIGAQPGYEVKLGEALRTQEQAALNAEHGTGILHSEHLKSLAIDLLVFKDGVWLTDSAAYKPFGDWWKAQSTPDVCCAWGGDFQRVDGNHFSIEDGGVE